MFHISQKRTNSTGISFPTNKYIKPGLVLQPRPPQESSAPGVNFDLIPQLNGKDIYEIDLDSLEEKPWRKPGADITDYFNYGFNETTWNIYSQKQSQLRTEFLMQKKINVFFFFSEWKLFILFYLFFNYETFHHLRNKLIYKGLPRTKDGSFWTS